MNYLKETFKVIMVFGGFIVFSCIIDFLLLKIFNNRVVVNYAIYLELYMLIWISLCGVTIKDFLKQNKANSLYDWLDKHNNSPLFIKDLLEHSSSKEFMYNLETTYNSILVYANHDIKKLRMLRAYMRSLNTENGLEALSKMLLKLLIGPIIIVLINKGSIEKLGIMNQIHSINSSFTFYLNLITVAIMLITMTVTLIDGLYLHKKRNKIIEEMIDACIEDLK
ncbi:hypothetical protein MUB15_06045 [Priestia sp. OVS21]|nr:hypothetical protein [Priestia sp. OVS21]